MLLQEPVCSVKRLSLEIFSGDSSGDSRLYSIYLQESQVNKTFYILKVYDCLMMKQSGREMTMGVSTYQQSKHEKWYCLKNSAGASVKKKEQGDIKMPTLSLPSSNNM